MRRLIILSVLTLAVVAGVGVHLWRRSRVHLPWAVEALQQIDFGRAAPIAPELLAHNPLRRAAGMSELPVTALVAPTNLRICDGPAFTVVLDAQRQPVLVISEHGGRTCEPAWTEYEVRNGALNGRSAHVVGQAAGVVRDGPLPAEQARGGDSLLWQQRRRVCPL